jgi:osmotically-inducible protein OsmY
MRTNEAIKKDIVDQIYWDDRVDASEVHLEINNRVVTLTGTVPTYRAKMAAEDNAWAIDGVTLVLNQLRVEHPTVLALPTDEQIKTRVKNAFMDDPDIFSFKIDVDIDDGWVTLKGTVDSYWKKMEAEDEAAAVRGVLGVTNELAVVPTEKASDESIAKKVVNALERNVNIDNVEDITVSVRNGIVKLTGTVPSYIAK